MKKLITIVGMLLCAQSALTAQDTARADASLSAATVFFGYGAELTHNANIKVNTSTKQIIISQLSTAIDVNSLQISVPENVALLSQRFLVYTPERIVLINPLIKKWQDSIKIFQKDQNRNKWLAETERETLDKTNKLIEMTMKDNGNKAISSDEAIKLINANTLKIEKAKTALFKLSEEWDLLNEKISAMQTRIYEANNQPVKVEKPYGQLMLQVICNSTTEIPVSLSYFTNNAGFTPLYDVRVNSKTNELKLVYKASITQSTGINWKQVKLTLSTSNPSWGGVAPNLTPWYLQMYVKPLYDNFKAPVVNNYYQNNIQSMMKDDKSLMEEVVVTGYGAAKKNRSVSYATTTVNPSSIQQYTTLTESQLNTNFEIDLPYNIDSDGETHSVTIKEEKINAGLKNYAIPKLDKDAYLLAEIADWQKLDLLPGVANIIMDQTYIGKSVIDPNSTADTLNLSLGKDKRVNIKRTAVKEYTSSKTSGSTTKQVFTYELTVKNNKISPVDLLLKDQYPISTVKEIEVKLEEGNGALVNEESGILSWKLNLKPGESRKLRFSYTVKYPKEMKITNL
ncbi:MAG: DUF4139 domain-containing protein [Ferruginibacter sp.]